MSSPIRTPPLPEVDARLQMAMEHAPLPELTPSPAIRQAVFAHAAQAVNGAHDRPLSWLDRLAQWLGLEQLGKAGMTGAAASVLLVVIVGMLWGAPDRREQAFEQARPSQSPDPTVGTAKLEKIAPRSAARALETTPAVPTPAQPPEPVVTGSATAYPLEDARPQLANQERRRQMDSAATASGVRVAEGVVAAPIPPAPAAVAKSVAQARVSPDKLGATSNTTANIQHAQLPPSGALAQLSVQPWTCTAGRGLQCHEQAARDLLQSDVLRRALATVRLEQASAAGQVKASGTAVVVEWLAAGKAQSHSMAKLVWESAERQLTWVTPEGTQRVQLSEPDAESLQQLLSATLSAVP